MVEKAREIYAILEKKVCATSTTPFPAQSKAYVDILDPHYKPAFCPIAFGLGLANP